MRVVNRALFPQFVAPGQFSHLPPRQAQWVPVIRGSLEQNARFLRQHSQAINVPTPTWNRMTVGSGYLSFSLNIPFCLRNYCLYIQ
jgi:hypothetical protein